MKSLLFLGASLFLMACAEAPKLVSSDVLAPATHDSTQIRHIHGLALLADYTARPVSDPDDWRRLNDAQSPAHGRTN